MQPGTVGKQQELPYLVESVRGSDLHAVLGRDEQFVTAIPIHVGRRHPAGALGEHRPRAVDRQHRTCVRSDTSAAVPEDPHLVAAGEDHLPHAVSVQVGQRHLHGVVGRQPQRRVHGEPVAAPPIEE